MRFLYTLALCASAVQAIWPLPTNYSHGSAVLWLDRSVRVEYNGVPEVLWPSSLPPDPPDRDKASLWEGTYGYQAVLQGYRISSSGNGTGVGNATAERRMVTGAIERAFDTLFGKNFVPWMFHPRGEVFEPETGEDRVVVKSIALWMNGSVQADFWKRPVGELDEGYSLEMSEAGEIEIMAGSPVGILYGLTTLTQLFYQHTNGNVYTPLAPVSITDKPKFPWRGLNVDTARTFKPLEDLFRTVDALSYAKMNRLHWHVTDSQSWPLEIPALPELANKGAYTSTQKYSSADVRALQDYGAQLGVEVVLELDMPGHTSSIAHAYPELIAAFNMQPDWYNYAAEPPSGTLKLNSSAVPAFLSTLFADLLPRLTPYTSHFHLGGDEVTANAYTLDPTTNSSSPTLLRPLMQRFLSTNLAHLASHNLTPIVWEEMLLTWNLTLPPTTLIQSWQSSANVAAIASRGHKVLAGNYDFWYLDCGHGSWLAAPPNSSLQTWPYQDYCAPRHNWRVVYSYDPLRNVPAHDHHLVMGGETHIWSEQTDTVNLDSVVWPRAAVAGEVLWRGGRNAQGGNLSQVEAEPRLAEFRERLVAKGVGAEVVVMPACLMEGGCVL